MNKIKLVSMLIFLGFWGTNVWATVLPDSIDRYDFWSSDSPYETMQLTGMYTLDSFYNLVPDSQAVSGTKDILDVNVLTETELFGIFAQLTSVLTPTSTDPLVPSTYSATSLAGLFDENYVSGNFVPDNNIGQEGDGLLNGDSEVFTIVDKTYNGVDYDNYTYSFDGTEFLPGGEADFQNLDNGGEADDPGWITLATNEGADLHNLVYEDVTNPINDATVQIIDVLDLRLYLDPSDDKYGKWALVPDLDILNKVSDVIGPNFFDQIAFMLKAGNDFGVFNFNFNEIYAKEKDLGNDLVFKPYVLTGTFDNTIDFIGNNPNGGGTGLSHYSIFAHDPAAPNNAVPEPSTLILLGSGLLGLGVYARRRKK